MPNLKPRPGIDKLLEVLDSKLKGHEKPFIIAELPTGYGKTTASPYIYKLVNEYGISDRVIHVLPLRAIIRKLIQDITDEGTWIGSLFREIRLGINDIAYQMGEFVVNVRKEPFFDAKYTLTTLDSFVHNLFKIPITELYRDKKHYFIPLGRIFTSTVLLDEAHIALAAESEKTISTVIASINALLSSHVPIVMMTATLPSKYEKLIIEKVNNIKKARPIVIRLGKKEEVKSNEITIITVHDPDFENTYSNVKYVHEKVSKLRIIDKAMDEVNNGRRVLIVLNNIRKVINIYREISDRINDSDIALVHSKLIGRDREMYESRINKVKVLIGTSAIEAGVDVSFDTLITTIDNPMSFIQRIGRICRKGPDDCADGEGRIYLINDDSDNLEGAINYVLTKKINWRLPYNVSNDFMGYMEFLETFTEKMGAITYDERHLSILNRVFMNIYISSKTLNELLKLTRGSLLREPLINVFIGDLNKPCSDVGINEFLERSFTIDLSEVVLNKSGFCAKMKECMVGIGILENDVLSCSYLTNDSEDFKKSLCTDNVYNMFFKLVEKYKAPLVIIIKDECYEEGIGFKLHGG
ncbi:CRISPR-associated helicase Cas3' [Caldivirga maquilingensis]|uniref:CRISPR-associated helicase Cas3 n=1 Tax=Caldivirga maquilingensis (strain ATCC 700844 / DSM 13496 / JCM 10307 / IC-167) TaxID=397948 RepID=A8M9D0_CALMQ|nr:CRISPR-associated helicase Cas3' [Caldivirga maquilingensis]ABW02349.1 CRISPR-associated helicase Cas3 [Caldivirga maquilingensis IC-167]